MIAPSTTLSDAELIDVGTGSGPEAERAWRLLFERINPSLERWLESNTSATAADAEEIAAEAWARLFRHAHKYDPERSSVRSYLTLIAERLAANQHRDRRQHGTLRFGTLAGRENDGSAWLQRHAGPNGDNPAEQFERRRKIEALEDALDELDPKRRPVVEGRLNGRDYAEIAAELEIPTGTAKSRYSRGRRRLAEKLAERGVGEVAAT